MSRVLGQGDGNGGAPADPPRATLHDTCQGREAVVEAAVDRAVGMTSDTIGTLEALRSMMTMRGGPSEIAPRIVAIVRNMFGGVTGLENQGRGGVTNIGRIIEDYGRILAGLRSDAKVLRCDPETVNQGNECDFRAAFVDPARRDHIYLCPQFFDEDVTVDSRAQTLVHEMAHSALGAEHEGVPDAGVMLADCVDDSLGITFEQARNNAYAYGILAGCLHGDYGGGLEVTAEGSGAEAAGGEPGSGDRPLSLSVEAGSALTPEARFLAGVGSQLSLRTGEFVVFNPLIGLNVFYAPPGEEGRHLVTALGDVGLRIQQPLEGLYFDLAASGFGSATVPTGPGEVQVEGGIGGMAGIGWRWERIELGARARALFPLGGGDPATVWIAGRAGVRF